MAGEQLTIERNGTNRTSPHVLSLNDNGLSFGLIIKDRRVVLGNAEYNTLVTFAENKDPVSWTTLWEDSFDGRYNPVLLKKSLAHLSGVLQDATSSLKPLLETNYIEMRARLSDCVINFTDYDENQLKKLRWHPQHPTLANLDSLEFLVNNPNSPEAILRKLALANNTPSDQFSPDTGFVFVARTEELLKLHEKRDRLTPTETETSQIVQTALDKYKISSAKTLFRSIFPKKESEIAVELSSSEITALALSIFHLVGTPIDSEEERAILLLPRRVINAGRNLMTAHRSSGEPVLSPVVYGNMRNYMFLKLSNIPRGPNNSNQNNGLTDAEILLGWVKNPIPYSLKNLTKAALNQPLKTIKHESSIYNNHKIIDEDIETKT